METVYRSTASVGQDDLEFFIPVQCDKYIDLNIRLFLRGKLTPAKGNALDEVDHTAVTKNFVHSFVSQCSVTLNGKTVTQTELYYYHSLLETLLTYFSDAAASHLTIAF